MALEISLKCTWANNQIVNRISQMLKQRVFELQRLQVLFIDQSELFRLHRRARIVKRKHPLTVGQFVSNLDNNSQLIRQHTLERVPARGIVNPKSALVKLCILDAIVFSKCKINGFLPLLKLRRLALNNLPLG